MPHVMPDRIPSSADALGELAKKYQTPVTTAHRLTPIPIVIILETGLVRIGFKSLGVLSGAGHFVNSDFGNSKAI